MPDRGSLLRILDLARWAPSGDNTQPWRFEILADDHIAVHGFDTRDDILYDFDGHPSHMAHGALLETLRMAATREGLAADWTRRPGSTDAKPIYDVRLRHSPGLRADELASHIETRCVQRRPLRTTPLDGGQQAALQAAIGSDYTLAVLASPRQRLSVARLLWNNAWLRLRCPEAFEVHRSIIEWGARYSVDRIPEQAVGVDPMTARLMQWVMQSWQRVEFFNRYLGGTILPRLQLDWMPAMACGAHLLMRPRQSPQGLEDHVRAGIAMQRLWLTASALGLQLQPQMTPVIFRWYVQGGRRISTMTEIDRRAILLARDFEALVGAEPDAPFAFFCRVGFGASARSRSVRKELGDLMIR